jgi:hypothetical protein
LREKGRRIQVERSKSQEARDEKQEARDEKNKRSGCG